MQHLLINNPLWLFCIQQYQKSQCRKALLMLQDNTGLNVNMLLLMQYATVNKVAVNVRFLQFCLRDHVELMALIEKKRGQRRLLQHSQPEEYEAAKYRELELERCHVAHLWQSFSQSRATFPVLDDKSGFVNIDSYLMLMGLSPLQRIKIQPAIKQLMKSFINQ